ncbi:transposase, partial [Enterococcus faecium]|uniref:transposase n=1 Tax=Enterococcus faecium TaxID=1352 RepID=UPI000B1547E7
IMDFAILSDGQKIDNNKFTSKMEKKLKREQRKLSRRALLAKNKGTNLFEAKNYQKQKRKVARLHEKVMNQRTDFLNKLSTELTKNFPTMHEEVSEIYGMDIPTYRIVIGKSYALFYRIDHEKKEILVGRIFQSKQMKLGF